MSFGMGVFVGALAVYFLMAWAVSRVDERDSTDAPGGRSGMELHTDHKTGLQYLSVSGGGLTPRLDASGKQMRAEDDQ